MEPRQLLLGEAQPNPIIAGEAPTNPDVRRGRNQQLYYYVILELYSNEFVINAFNFPVNNYFAKPIPRKGNETIESKVNLIYLSSVSLIGRLNTKFIFFSILELHPQSK